MKAFGKGRTLPEGVYDSRSYRRGPAILKSALVVDASVALSWCFPDEQSDYGNNVLEALCDITAHVPNHWHLEITNAIVMGERRKRLSSADISRFLVLLDELSPAIDPFPSQGSMSHILPLCRTYSLPSYDAAYLELAMREGVPLATLDSKLREAAALAGVSVFPDK